jgi:ATP-dependent Clp protease, protease subunit
MKNRLLQLLADNRAQALKARSQPRVHAAGDSATIYLYDPIVGDRLTAEYWGGVCPQEFVPELAGLDVSTIHLRINSPGGDVWAANAMCQAIREHKAKVIAHIDGIAASAATAIACACDEVVMGRDAMYMIHNAWCLAMGNAADLREVADLLDKVDQQLAQTYADRTGKPLDEVVAWMAAETWFSAQETLDAGFADSIEAADDKGKARASARWSLQAYQRAPKQPEPAPAPPAPPVASDEHRDRQRQRLAVAGRLLIA